MVHPFVRSHKLLKYLVHIFILALLVDVLPCARNCKEKLITLHTDSILNFFLLFFLVAFLFFFIFFFLVFYNHTCEAASTLRLLWFCEKKNEVRRLANTWTPTRNQRLILDYFLINRAMLFLSKEQNRFNNVP